MSNYVNVGNGSNSQLTQMLLRNLSSMKAARSTIMGTKTPMHEVRNIMLQQLNGDGSADAHYDEIMNFWGFVSTAKAHAAFNEISSVCGRMENNGGAVTWTQLTGAIDQIVAIMGV